MLSCLATETDGVKGQNSLTSYQMDRWPATHRNVCRNDVLFLLQDLSKAINSVYSAKTPTSVLQGFITVPAIWTEMRMWMVKRSDLLDCIFLCYYYFFFFFESEGEWRAAGCVEGEDGVMVLEDCVIKAHKTASLASSRKVCCWFSPSPPRWPPVKGFISQVSSGRLTTCFSF